MGRGQKPLTLPVTVFFQRKLVINMTVKKDFKTDVIINRGC